MRFMDSFTSIKSGMTSMTDKKEKQMKQSKFAADFGKLISKIRESRGGFEEDDYATFDRQIRKDFLNGNIDLTGFAVNKFSAMQRAFDDGDFDKFFKKLIQLKNKYSSEVRNHIKS